MMECTSQECTCSAYKAWFGTRCKAMTSILLRQQEGNFADRVKNLKWRAHKGVAVEASSKPSVQVWRLGEIGMEWLDQFQIFWCLMWHYKWLWFSIDLQHVFQLYGRLRWKHLIHVCGIWEYVLAERVERVQTREVNPCAPWSFWYDTHVFMCVTWVCTGYFSMEQ